MIKFSKWLWRKAEAITVREVIALLDSFYKEPSPVASAASKAELIQYSHAISTYRDYQRFRGVLLRHFDRVFDDVAVKGDDK